jgi:hypothetical protein
MESLGPGQIMFRVHGPDTETDEVAAAVFARQLGILSRALRAADKAINGRLVHDYFIASLSTSAPTALLAERPLPRFARQLITGHSGIDAFEECISAISAGDRGRALRYEGCAKQLAKFSSGGYSEVWTGNSTVFRVDPFLTERARLIVKPEIETNGHAAPERTTAREWFKGIAAGSFDGEIKAADLRGALPQITIVLTAGGNEIDCICREGDIESIRAALDRRARVYGQAIYDGKSGLPRRIEVSKIEVIGGSKDFTRYKGAFKPFEIETWEDES